MSDKTELMNDNFDILNGGVSIGIGIQILSQIAKDILVIPVSTLTLESRFRTRGHILNPFRSSLTPKTVGP